MSTSQPMSAGSAVDAPIAPTDRLATLDVLRGFAVMAIFIVNIKGMVMPFGYYMNGSLWATELEQHIAVLQKFLVDDRWRTIFTALFGAGLVLISEKSEARGQSSAGRLLTRNFWLMVFGAIHLILIWVGDILFMYSLAGMLAMWFRKRSVVSLSIWATIILLIASVWFAGFSMFPAYEPVMAAELGAEMWGTDPDILREQIAAGQGTVMEQISGRLMDAVGFIVFYGLLGGFLPVTVGIMMWGMVLYKTGMLRGTWSLWSTLLLTVIGLGGATALEFIQTAALKESAYDFAVYSQMAPLSLIDGYLGALGFAALIISLVKMGIAFGPVAAVGRMAFTNYILCSLIGTTLAGGHIWGFGWYGEASLVQLMTVVGVTFIGMLIWSPLWLGMFRFGPLEWLWRSLSYGKLQPLRK